MRLVYWSLTIRVWGTWALSVTLSDRGHFTPLVATTKRWGRLTWQRFHVDTSIYPTTSADAPTSPRPAHWDSSSRDL